MCGRFASFDVLELYEAGFCFCASRAATREANVECGSGGAVSCVCVGFSGEGVALDFESRGLIATRGGSVNDDKLFVVVGDQGVVFGFVAIDDFFARFSVVGFVDGVVTGFAIPTKAHAEVCVSDVGDDEGVDFVFVGFDLSEGHAELFVSGGGEGDVDVWLACLRVEADFDVTERFAAAGFVGVGFDDQVSGQDVSAIRCGELDGELDFFRLRGSLGEVRVCQHTRLVSRCPDIFRKS